MSGRLDGQVGVITGGASGMGKATVLRFLGEGASVVVGDLNAEAGQALVDEVGSDQLRFMRTDVSVEEDVASLVSMASEAFGRLDVMFNNAGIGGAFGPITEIELADWERTFAILVSSVFLGTKYAARTMIDQNEGGSIINTASIAGLSAGAGPQAYSAAKAAVVNLSQTTAVELAPHQIRVNTICPGVIYTPLMHGGDERDIESADETINEAQPWPRRGEGADIAGAALFLASDDSEFFTGQAMTVDGGLTAAGPRIQGRLRNNRNLHRMVGMAFGSTGERARVRRLEE
ncbi:MAG: glucose 1-dehydrogenase [Actinomycetia bacterium]|nr:glucose 1-dehydrogenase [Actinomycetes bacterium]MCP3912937.1 glucose 1-dehydrogenase [Actinomycetes bacterium]MCP4086270.1 glucose 1-dehydrogenase [Actinomycetes bacterium]